MNYLSTKAWYVVLGIVLGFVGFLYSIDLGHVKIAPWDEIVHVNVVKNLAQNCCVPVLHVSDLGTGLSDWTNNYVWLHKPYVPMLLQAAVYKLGGLSLFAFRFAHVLFALLTGLLIWLAARKTVGYVAATVALVVFLMNPYLYAQIQGLAFSGMHDILLLCVHAAIIVLLFQYLKKEQSYVLLLLGVCFGVGYITKSGLALLPLPVVVFTIFHKQRWNITKTALHVALLLFATAIIAVPDHLYFALKFPKEFLFEQQQHVQHIFADVEVWKRPFDAYFSNYLYILFGLPVLPLVCISLVHAIISVKTNPKYGILLGYVAVFLVPLSFFVSKINNFIFPIVIPLSLLVGFFVEDVVREKKFGLALTAILVGVGGWIVLLFYKIPFIFLTDVFELEYTSSQRLIWLVVSLVIAVLAYVLGVMIGRGIKKPIPFVLAGMVVFMCGFFSYFGVRNIQSKHEQIIAVNTEQESMRQSALRAKDLLPKNSLVIVPSESLENPHLYFMYWSGLEALWDDKVPTGLRYPGPVYELKSGEFYRLLPK